MRRKSLIIYLMSVISFSAHANPMFGTSENQVSVYGALGTGGSSLSHLYGDGWQYVPFGYWSVMYSQPTSFFRAPARQTLSAGAVMDGEKGTEKIGADIHGQFLV